VSTVQTELKLPRLEWGAAIHQGLVRHSNEDCHHAGPYLFAVADGMGGHDAGELASQIAINVLAELASNTTLAPPEIEANLWRANTNIRELAGSWRNSPGTTVTGVCLTAQEAVPQWLFFNIGDSRSYLLRDNTLEQISEDHSLTAELLARGEITEAERDKHPGRSVITRSLGGGSTLQPEVDQWQLQAKPGDRLLLCSDGLYSEVGADSIRSTLCTIGDPQEVSDTLVELALASGGRDNITVVVIDLLLHSIAN
jgi:PPM family protein phosphatase